MKSLKWLREIKIVFRLFRTKLDHFLKRSNIESSESLEVFSQESHRIQLFEFQFKTAFADFNSDGFKSGVRLIQAS